MMQGNRRRRKCDRRIAIIYRLYNPGGVQSVVLSLIKGLNQHGIIPDIIWDIPPSRKMLDEKRLMANYFPVNLPFRSSLLDHLPISLRYLLLPFNTFSTHDIARQYDFFFIFFNGFLVEDGTRHVRYLSGPPLIPQLDVVSPGLRGIPYRMFRQIYLKVLRKRFPAYEFHRESNYVINSHFTADLFEEAHGIRLPIVHPPIDLTGRSYAPDDLSIRDSIVFFSRFVPYKRPEMVLALARRYPHQRVVLMGGVKPQYQAYFSSLQEKARKEGLENVHFIENPSNERVNQELAQCRFYVFPAPNEHFGMTTAEAIGAGAIPFVHDSGGQREIVPNSTLRFTDEHFFEQFDFLFTRSPEELNEIREQITNYVQRFTEQAFIEKMLRIMDSPCESEFLNELQVESI